MEQKTYQYSYEKTQKFAYLSSSIILLLTLIFSGHAFAQYTYTWKTDTTYEGADSVNLVQPVQVMFLDEPIRVVPHSASLRLMQQYSVLLGTEWSAEQTYRLLQTFESVPQLSNNLYEETPKVPSSLWQLTDQHIQNDIEIRIQDGQKIVTLSMEAFTYADPLLAEIEGVRGRFFSKRLHHSIVRYVTGDGRDRRALKRILEKRYGVSLDVPDYTELTRRTTKEDAGRFGEFKNEELMALVSMFEEYPQGLHSTPGLQYLVRRVELEIPDYFPGGTYKLNFILMEDIALNARGVYFTDPGHGLRDEDVIIDEAPATIDVQTTNPDTIPPVLDLNQITIQAEPTHPEAPNGETLVDITFRIKDNISGYSSTGMYLRDPNGVRHHSWHPDQDYHKVYFTRDPTVYQTHHQRIILPVGSIPGTWGLAEMSVRDKAQNILRANFTEIIHFELGDTPLISADFDGDGQVALENFLAFVHAFGTHSGQENFDPKFDLDSNGEVGLSDFLIFVNSYGKPVNG